MACIERFAAEIPTLGVCLGHQSIGQAFGAEIVRARRLMHGKTDLVYHDDRGLFAGLENPFQATRYHSLVIRPGTLSDEFDLCAWCDGPEGEKEIMGIRHRRYPLHGLQFHPESFLTPRGSDMLRSVPGHSPAGRRGPRQVNVYAHGRRSLGPGSRASGAAASLHPSVGRRARRPYWPKT